MTRTQQAPKINKKGMMTRKINAIIPDTLYVRVQKYANNHYDGNKTAVIEEALNKFFKGGK